MTPESFASLAHLNAALPTSGSNLVEDFLRTRGLARRISIEIPNPFWVVPVVKRTDLCAVMPEKWIDLNPCDPEIAILSLPVADDRFTVEQFWHVRNDRDPGHRWLRGIIAEIFRPLAGGGPLLSSPQSAPNRTSP
jgi:DNA-binding transcriptional LysR family regulator